MGRGNREPKRGRQWEKMAGEAAMVSNDWEMKDEMGDGRQRGKHGWEVREKSDKSDKESRV